MPISIGRYAVMTWERIDNICICEAVCNYCRVALLMRGKYVTVVAAESAARKRLDYVRRENGFTRFPDDPRRRTHEKTRRARQWVCQLSG